MGSETLLPTLLAQRRAPRKALCINYLIVRKEEERNDP
jgi:hypothetical protein